MNTFIIIDLGMAVVFFVIGMYFYASNGKAANLLAGYNDKPADERKKFDENQMCKDYGKRMMLWAVPFLIGAVIDVRFAFLGSVIAWVIWVVMFIFLLNERKKRES